MRNGVDMTRIESRPAPNTNWEYFFFMDVDGHQETPELAKALDELREEAEYLRVLGSYSKAIL